MNTHDLASGEIKKRLVSPEAPHFLPIYKPITSYKKQPEMAVLL